MIRRVLVQNQPGKKVSKTLHLNKQSEHGGTNSSLMEDKKYQTLSEK
jgi:hypothetical protein